MIYLLIVSLLLLIILILILYIKEINWIYNKTCKINKELIEYTNICKKLIRNQNKIMDAQKRHIELFKKEN